MSVELEGSLAGKVLVVDDDPDIVKYLRLMLMLEGYEVVEAFQGHEGLDVAKQESPDVILLDIMMADLDGFEVFKRLQCDPETNDIPVVFVTAKTAREDVEQGLSLGALGYVKKPFKPSELLEKVSSALA